MQMLSHPSCFKGRSCMRLAHVSAQSWCRQHVAFTFTLLSSVAMTIFHRRKLKSSSMTQLTFVCSQIYSNFQTITSCKHTPQKQEDVDHSFFTPAPHLHHPPLIQGKHLQIGTQTTAYFRNKTTRMISKHLEFKTPVFSRNLVTCVK